MEESPEWIIVGRISSAHGVRGEVKVQFYLDDADFLRDAKTLFLEGRPQRREVGVKRLRITSGNQGILSLEGMESRTEAEQLRGRELSVPRSWLPELEEDEYYVVDIIGLSVETTEGDVLGRVEQVLFTGANEVYVVRGGPQGEILIPAIESVIQLVDLEQDRILVTLPEGLID